MFIKMFGYKNSRFGICLKSLPETTTGFDEDSITHIFAGGGFLTSLDNDRLFDLSLFILCFCIISIGKRSHCREESTYFPIN